MPALPCAATRPGNRDFLLAVSALLSVSVLLYLGFPPNAPIPAGQSTTTLPPPLSLHNILFSIASSSSSLRRRAPYIRLWHRPIDSLNTTFLFLERPPPHPIPPSIPPIIVPPNAASLSAGHRIAHIVKDAVALNVTGVCWYVFGDDDTLFFPANLVRILSKYDHKKWFYIGSSSESYEQNEKFSFDMAFGGGGFVISAPLAEVLAQNLDSCLDRYRHLYGSDARIFACLAELGVSLTVETGFHQVDVRGDLLGLLSAHPLALVASLHHIDAIEPIFPGMTRIDALDHLSKASRLDPARTFQQTVCYSHTTSVTVTVSISWGYAVQAYEGNQLLPQLVSLQRTFRPWKRGKNVASSHYMFNTRDYPCNRPAVFFLLTVTADNAGIWTEYTRYDAENCSHTKPLERLEVVSVYSLNLDIDIDQMEAPRRHCCDITSFSDEAMAIQIRKCGIHELIAMQV